MEGDGICGKASQNYIPSKYGHVAYPVKWQEEYGRTCIH